MTEVEYKGFTICLAPNELEDGSGWDHKFYIRQVTASGVTSRKIHQRPTSSPMRKRKRSRPALPMAKSSSTSGASACGACSVFNA
jgi:hypothetical protein